MRWWGACSGATSTPSVTRSGRATRSGAPPGWGNAASIAVRLGAVAALDGAGPGIGDHRRRHRRPPHGMGARRLGRAAPALPAHDLLPVVEDLGAKGALCEDCSLR